MVVAEADEITVKRNSPQSKLGLLCDKPQRILLKMRFLFKVSIPVEAGNAAVKKDNLAVIGKILEQQKPEAAYFVAEGGQRTAFLIMNMNDASEIPAIAEPWFLALNASIDVTPAMVAEDLQKATPAIALAAKAHG